MEAGLAFSRGATDPEAEGRRLMIGLLITVLLVVLLLRLLGVV